MGNQTENKKEMSVLAHPWRTFVFEIFLFSLSLALGILASIRLNEIFKSLEVTPSRITIWQFIVYFILVTLLLVLVVYFLKFRKGKKIFFKGMFLFTVAFGNLLFFGLWLPGILSFGLVILLIILLLKINSLVIHNLVLIFAIAGVGASLGLRLKPEMVILLLLIFSVYDYIAVYKTKHMVKIAKEMVTQKAILGIVIPQEISELQTRIKKVKPGGRFLVLGAGDIIFPLILSSSLVPQSISNSLIVALFSLIGLFFGFLIFISKKIRQPMPALPPIALFSIIGYLITKII